MKKSDENKVVVITGGTSGIGKEIANIYISKNNIVCILAKDAKTDVQNNIFECDVTNEQQVKYVIEQIAKKYNKIDIVVNCAGYGLAGALELTSIDDAKKQFETNMIGTMIVNNNCIKFMQQNSVIINISSTCALFALPYRGLYCASKSAVDMYSKCLKMELAPSKINVISICPGDTKTNFSKNRIKIFETNNRYGDRIQKSIQKVEGNQEKRMSPVYVANKIVKYANKKHPKAMYIIGTKYKFLYYLSKILPQNTMLKIINNIFNK